MMLFFVGLCHAMTVSLACICEDYQEHFRLKWTHSQGTHITLNMKIQQKRRGATCALLSLLEIRFSNIFSQARRLPS